VNGKFTFQAPKRRFFLYGAAGQWCETAGFTPLGMVKQERVPIAPLGMVKQERVPIVPPGHGENIKKSEKETFHMSRVDVVRASMVEAMKAKDKDRKDSLSMLLSALKNAEIDKRSPLTEEEADAVVKKEIKQTKETLELAPADRADIREEAQARLAVYQEFAPEDLTEEQIAEVIKSVLAELGIENPAPSDKGKIMKTLMPKVKGKADGKVVNQVLAGILSK